MIPVVMKQECAFRLLPTQRGKVVMAICHNSDHPKYKQIVRPETCDYCDLITEPKPTPQRPQDGPIEPPTITPDGTLTYIQKGWEPPPCPPGYKMKSYDMEGQEVWVLKPSEPLCKHISMEVGKLGKCGCHHVIPICTHGDEPIEVDHLVCLECQQRESRDVPNT